MTYNNSKVPAACKLDTMKDGRHKRWENNERGDQGMGPQENGCVLQQYALREIHPSTAHSLSDWIMTAAGITDELVEKS